MKHIAVPCDITMPNINQAVTHLHKLILVQQTRQNEP